MLPEDLSRHFDRFLSRSSSRAASALACFTGLFALAAPALAQQTTVQCYATSVPEVNSDWKMEQEAAGNPGNTSCDVGGNQPPYAFNDIDDDNSWLKAVDFDGFPLSQYEIVTSVRVSVRARYDPGTNPQMAWRIIIPNVYDSGAQGNFVNVPSTTACLWRDIPLELNGPVNFVANQALLNEIQVWVRRPTSANGQNTLRISGFRIDITTKPDSDGDGFADDVDNCDFVNSPNQNDADGDGLGDVCDPCTDTDGDTFGNPGYPNTCVMDNCPSHYNPSQSDNDHDGQGDACDGDDDNDGVGDQYDNCPLAFNPNQADNDNDGQGDVCDGDDDNDGVGDPYDNCQFAFNPNQADNDYDGQGDVCDGDDDNDGVGDPYDNCQFAANPSQADNDHDGQGDVCDGDDDNDGVGDQYDNCPLVANPGQSNHDGDGQGDACDDDDDNDGVLDPVDNCPLAANPTQSDQDGDWTGDACDTCTDTDGDGFGDPGFAANTCPDDNCPLAFNPNQLDREGDGVGDECDNCLDLPNASQADCDNDGVGDVCELAATPPTQWDANQNHIPDQCEQCGLVVTYCTAGTSSHGCTPSMSSVGAPSVSQPWGFYVRCGGMEGKKSALMYYGLTGPMAVPLNFGSTSFQCVRAPYQRMAVLATGGVINTCTGSVQLDMLDYWTQTPAAMGAPLAPGAIVNVQTWYRDPQAIGGTNLSNALQFTLCP